MTILYGKDAENFLKKLHSGKKVPLVSTPKFDKLRKEILLEDYRRKEGLQSCATHGFRYSKGCVVCDQLLDNEKFFKIRKKEFQEYNQYRFDMLKDHTEHLYRKLEVLAERTPEEIKEGKWDYDVRESIKKLLDAINYNPVMEQVYKRREEQSKKK